MNWSERIKQEPVCFILLNVSSSTKFKAKKNNNLNAHAKSRENLLENAEGKKVNGMEFVHDFMASCNI